MEKKETKVAFVNDCHLGLVKDIKEYMILDMLNLGYHQDDENKGHFMHRAEMIYDLFAEIDELDLNEDDLIIVKYVEQDGSYYLGTSEDISEAFQKLMFDNELIIKQ